MQQTRRINRLVDLNKYKESVFPGVIDKTEVMVLEDYLGDNVESFIANAKRFPDNIKTSEQKKKYMLERVKQTVLVITYTSEIEGKATTNTDFLTIPKVTGWAKSKMSELRERNDLPWDTEQWDKKPVKTYAVDGFLKLFPEK